MYYHASDVAGIKVLKLAISNHGKPLVYLSEKRENVLVYLSNAVEKYCKENGFIHNGKWHKWASYGFDSDGIMRIDEYYPNALEDTYKGVSGYIYRADVVVRAEADINIRDAVATAEDVCVLDAEYIEDAYAEIIKSAEAGLIRLRRYEDLSDKMYEWIKSTVIQEYNKAENEPDYRFFLKAKFDFLDACL